MRRREVACLDCYYDAVVGNYYGHRHARRRLLREGSETRHSERRMTKNGRKRSDSVVIERKESVGFVTVRTHDWEIRPVCDADCDQPGAVRLIAVELDARLDLCVEHGRQAAGVSQ